MSLGDGGNKKPVENGLFGDGGGEAAARAPGRPKGATNKRWQKWQALAGTMRVHPVEFLLRTVAKDERELAEDLDLVVRADDGSISRDASGRPILLPTALRDAHNLRASAARDVLPYVEQRAPTAVEDVSEGGPGRMVIVVGQLNGTQQGQVQQRFGWALRGEQNQHVIDAQPATSDEPSSDGEANQLKLQQD